MMNDQTGKAALLSIIDMWIRKFNESADKEESDHVRDLSSLLEVGDELADNVIMKTEGEHEGIDLFNHIFKSNLNSADSEDLRLEFVKECEAIPPWVDNKKIRRGQLFFWNHIMSFLTSILYGGLLPGYGFVRMSKTLTRTGYLLNTSKHPDALKPGHKGWEAIIRVRLLHASVRNRIQKSDERLHQHRHTHEVDSLSPTAECPMKKINLGGIRNPVPGLSPAEEGDTKVINQADMIGTLFAFQIIPLMMINERTAVSRGDMEDYTAVWRYIGHIIGIRPENNPCKDGALQSLHILRAYTDLYFDANNSISRALVQSLLDSLSKVVGNRDRHLILAREYIPAALCEELGLEEPGRDSALSYAQRCRRFFVQYCVIRPFLLLLHTPLADLAIAWIMLVIDWTMDKVKGDKLFLSKTSLS